MVSSSFQQQMCDKAQLAIRYMKRGLVGRDQEVSLILLAALAGHHSLMVGTPGTAKSMIARRLETVFDLASSRTMPSRPWFQILLMRFTKPDELFGPLDLQSLKGTPDTPSKYKRNTEHYLPEARFAFLDEIFKASSPILNALLTILNERKFYNDGEVFVDLISVIAASNELPRPGTIDTTSDALTALYDRFLVRMWVDNLAPDEFRVLLDGYCGKSELALATIRNLSREHDSSPGSDEGDSFDQPPLRIDDIKVARDTALREVQVPYPIRMLLFALRDRFTEYGQEVDKSIAKAIAEQDLSTIRPPFYVSDRRWKWIVEFLKVAAWYDNRTFLALKDLALLQFLVPCDKPDIVAVQNLALRCDELFSKDSLRSIDDRVAGIAAHSASSTSRELQKTCLAELHAIASVFAEAYAVNNATQLEHLWVTPAAMQDSIIAARAGLGKGGDVFAEKFDDEGFYTPIREALDKLHDALEANEESISNGESDGVLNQQNAMDSASQLSFPELGISFSRLDSPSDAALGVDGWPGSNPPGDVYISDSPVLRKTWNAVMNTQLGVPDASADTPLDDALDHFFGLLHNKIANDKSLNGKKFSVRLMTVNEWRLALWHAAGKGPFESVHANDAFKSRVRCKDGAKTRFPRHDDLRQCSFPLLYTVLGMKPQLCNDDGERWLVGGADYSTFQECLDTALTPREVTNKKSQSAFRVVLEFNTQH